ncbi:arginase [Pseudogracilibacillus sp. ICA-222130]|uniref:arginase n=1 Tax=Pseudogracilibacillus sp. ICA-222130 TaxID=3134655 RepID=UPI0030C3839E
MNRNISIIGVPMDLGQLKRGVDMGPQAIRYAGVLEKLQTLQYDVHDFGDIKIADVANEDSSAVENVHNLTAVKKVNEALANTVDKTIERGEFPLIFGGDHSIAIGSLAGIAKHYDNIGVLWFDAHGDMNTDKTSPSGNIHGMSLAASLGHGHPSLIHLLKAETKVQPENVVLIGVRELDRGEIDLLRQLNVKVFTMHEVDTMGMKAVMDEALQYLQERTDKIHVSFDLDVLDPSEAPGVGTPVIGGITYREAHVALELLAKTNVVTSAEFVEVNPILDVRNKTAELTVALIGSLFGETLF